MPLTRRFVLSCLLAGFALAMPDQLLHAQPTPDLPASEQARLDNLVRVELESTGTPSASIAIVAGGRVVYRKAYGNAQISPHRAATSAMRGGMHTRVYDVQLTGKSFTLVVRAWPDGRIEQFMLFPK